ncbi:hypothetical protein [Dyella silvatica]|uniref:hypothetical protein n=1 Tax=Dyella silvatica TaxID=2992128 RepID=UPI002252874B|nr:hypothetical protein [Dyella silvatica]
MNVTVRSAAFFALAMGTVGLCAIAQSAKADGPRHIDQTVFHENNTFMCDYCGADNLEPRLKEVLAKTKYSGKWYAIDYFGGFIKLFNVTQEGGSPTLKELPVDDASKKLVDAFHTFYQANGGERAYFMDVYDNTPARSPNIRK